MRPGRIAGVGVDLEKLESIDYDTIFDMAMRTDECRNRLDREQFIAAELKKHGILKKRRTGNKGNQRGGDSGKLDTPKQGGDSPKGT